MTPTIAIPSGIKGDTLSRDPSVAEKTVDDPLCVKTTTARMAVAGLAEQERVRAICARGFGIPTLVLHGEADGLVPASASEILATAPLVERRTYPGLRHELHNEPEGPSVIDDIVAWLAERSAGVPGGHAGRTDDVRRRVAGSPAGS